MTKSNPNPDTRYAGKITPEQAEQVRRDRAAGKSIGEIARALGVGRSSIRAVIEGRSHRPKPTEPGP